MKMTKANVKSRFPESSPATWTDEPKACFLNHIVNSTHPKDISTAVAMGLDFLRPAPTLEEAGRLLHYLVDEEFERAMTYWFSRLAGLEPMADPVRKNVLEVAFWIESYIKQQDVRTRRFIRTLKPRATKVALAERRKQILDGDTPRQSGNQSETGKSKQNKFESP